MTHRDERPPGEGHEAVRELLPWYRTGRLQASEQAVVAAHLDDCAPCRDELESWATLESAVLASGAPAWEPPDGQLARLLDRIDALERPAPAQGAGARLRTWLEGLPSPAGWLLAGQTLAVAGLAALLLLPGPVDRTPFETRTRAGVLAPAEARVQVAFAPTASEAEIRRLLGDVGGAFVSGPTALGVYALAVDPELPLDALLERLRASPIVRLAEPVGPVR